MDQLAARARRWGDFGEARLDPGPMAEDEPDTALRLLADTLIRVAGASYRPRFRALSGLLDQVLATADFAATLAGCEIRRRGHSGPVLICREAAACEGPLPLAPDATLWDRRWQVTASGSGAHGITVAMLGEAGLGELRRQAEAGAADLPGAWVESPRQVRLTTPAVFKDGALLAAPLANYLNRAAVGSDFLVTARFSAHQQLPPHPPPAYGPAGSLDPPP